ncbi:MAG: TRAP transporter large permease subunit [Rhodospirillales bacterium]|jgi:tripartite ATP-independent transporter DctM subunit|nr:TRAP transporter large permease subunit [Rhodospirillales bacterium]
MSVWIIGMSLLLAVILMGMPIAFSMALVGFLGTAYIVGVMPALGMVAQVTYDTGLSYELSVVPLFILMGNLVTRSGLSEDLYRAANAWLGHLKGGLAMATVVACAGFASVCGSSLATAATMAKVAMPSMRKYGYHDSLAAGSIASGGTLGILIPPSVIMVIYGILTGTNIGKLFMAGILPGLVGMLGYIFAVAWTTWRHPDYGPRGERLPFLARIKAMQGVWGVLSLFLLVIGGIYLGVFTATEAAGIGAFGAFIFALARRTLTISNLITVLVETTTTTAMMFTVLIGALIFSNFVNLAGLPQALSGWVQGFDIHPMAVIGLILCIYLLLGCLLESLSMVMLTVPIFFPLVDQLGFDAIWFGILVVVMTEISMITPPVGLNVFVLRAVLPDVMTRTIFRGIMPFLGADIIRLAVIVFVPWLSLVLPSMMK